MSKRVEACGYGPGDLQLVDQPLDFVPAGMVSAGTQANGTPAFWA
jgi:hypothetical protein